AADDGCFDVSIVDETGMPCVELRSVAVRALADTLAGLSYAPVWRPALLAAAERREEHGAVLIAGSENAVVERFLRERHTVLTRDGGAGPFETVHFVAGEAEGDGGTV